MGCTETGITPVLQSNLSQVDQCWLDPFNLISTSKAGPHRSSIAPKFMLHSQKKTNARMRYLIGEMMQRERFPPDFDKLVKA